MDESKVETHRFTANIWSLFTVRGTNFVYHKDEVSVVMLYADKSAVITLISGMTVFTNAPITVHCKP